MRRRTAFTLIEILAVIAIIAILAAILFPVIMRAKGSAQQSVAITQFSQLTKGLLMYSQEHDEKFVPSTNYGAPEGSPDRMWQTSVMPFIKDQRLFVAPESQGSFAATWADRGLQSVGLSSATAFSPSGCADDLADSSGCQAFKSAIAFSQVQGLSQTAILAVTANGPTDQKYRGYEFSPYNGPINPVDIKLSPPMAGDIDLVKANQDLDADLLKPVFARYNATLNGDGTTPVAFADGSVKSYSANQINSDASTIVWRFR